MKILVTGDMHFRYELPYSNSIKDGRKEEWNNVKNVIQLTAKNCDAVVLLGDNFNARHNNSSVIKEFVNFLEEFGEKEVHILAGNHERYGTSTAIDFLKGLKPNWFIYTEPKLSVVAGQPVMMIPFMNPSLLGVDTKEKGVEELLKLFPINTTPLAFCHQGIVESVYYGHPVEEWNEIVLPKKMVEKHFWHTFAGHVHSKQLLFPSIYITGSVFTQEVGELSKSIWVYTSDVNMDTKIEEIQLPVRSIVKIIWEEGEIQDIPKNSIVKCYVTKRTTDIEEVKKWLTQFDASIVIEQYDLDRSKAHFESGVLDLSVETMLEKYAEAKNLPLQDLLQGFEIIKQ